MKHFQDFMDVYGGYICGFLLGLIGPNAIGGMIARGVLAYRKKIGGGK